MLKDLIRWMAVVSGGKMAAAAAAGRSRCNNSRCSRNRRASWVSLRRGSRGGSSAAGPSGEEVRLATGNCKGRSD